MEHHDETEWRGALQVAALAPNTGMVPVKSRTLLAAQAELEHLRAELAAKDARISAMILGSRQREAELRSYIR